MQSFLAKITLILFVLLLLYTGLHYMTLPEEEESPFDYTAAMADKHQRAHSIGSPKVILAGSSNAAFNLNSEMIQNEFGIPVVNTAIILSFGLDFMLNEIEDLADEGDVVFLFFTYYVDLEGLYDSKKNVASYYPRAENYFRTDLRKEVASHVRSTQGNTWNWIYTNPLGRERQIFEMDEFTAVYKRDNFNDFGDFIGHHGMQGKPELDQRGIIEYMYWGEGIRRLNRFYAEMEKREVSVFYVYTAYPISEYERNREVLETIHQDMTEGLHFPVLGRPDTFLFEDEYFFDTVYHLTQEGAINRTDKFIDLIYDQRQVNSALDTLFRYQEVEEADNTPLN